MHCFFITLANVIFVELTIGIFADDIWWIYCSYHNSISTIFLID